MSQSRSSNSGLGQSEAWWAEYVVLNPVDVTVLLSEGGEVLGYRIARSLLRPEHPAPGSLPKLPQSAFNLENDRGR